MDLNKNLHFILRKLINFQLNSLYFMIMKKTIIAIIGTVVLSLSFATAIYARAIAMSQDIDLDGRKAKCATEITSTGNGVMKCMPNGGCEWTDGSAVTYGGKC